MRKAKPAASGSGLAPALLWIVCSLATLSSCMKMVDSTPNIYHPSPDSIPINFPPPIPTIPQVSQFFPEAGMAGDTVDIFGYNFDPKPEKNIVLFDTVKASIIGEGTGRLTVIVPEGFTQGTIKVIVNHQAGVSADDYIIVGGRWAFNQFTSFNLGHACQFTLGDKLFIVSGKVDPITLRQGYITFDQSTNQWAEKAAPQLPGRENGIGFSIGNKGYIGLGDDGQGILFNDFWEFDPATETWTRKADFPGGPRSQGISFGIGNMGYTGMGLDSAGKQHNDFWSYDPATDTWSRLKDYPDNNLYGASSCSAGGRGYVIFGAHKAVENGAMLLADAFDIYNPTTDSWQELPTFPGYGRVNGVVVSNGNKLYAGLGSKMWQKDFWEYDITKNQWSRKTDFIQYFDPSLAYIVRNGSVAAALNGKIFAGFGNGAYGDSSPDWWEFKP